jgi:hypothetical protein
VKRVRLDADHSPPSEALTLNVRILSKLPYMT